MGTDLSQGESRSFQKIVETGELLSGKQLSIITVFRASLIKNSSRIKWLKSFASKDSSRSHWIGKSSRNRVLKIETWVWLVSRQWQQSLHYCQLHQSWRHNNYLSSIVFLIKKGQRQPAKKDKTKTSIVNKCSSFAFNFHTIILWKPSTLLENDQFWKKKKSIAPFHNATTESLRFFGLEGWNNNIWRARILLLLKFSSRHSHYTDRVYGMFCNKSTSKVWFQIY